MSYSIINHLDKLQELSKKDWLLKLCASFGEAKVINHQVILDLERINAKPLNDQTGEIKTLLEGLHTKSLALKDNTQDFDEPQTTNIEKAPKIQMLI